MVAQNTSDRSGGRSGDRSGEDAGGLEGRVLVGRYRIVTTVSAGANTIITAAHDLEADRAVTFKIVRPELAASEQFRRDFRRAADIALALTHPNIAALLDSGDVTIDGEPTVFWVVEHLGGGSLRDLFDRGRLLEPSQALVVGVEACRALDAAHQRGIAHTELTPSKLVFGVDRRLRIVDFAMAELLGRAAWSEPANVPTHVARYAAPEQAVGLPVSGKTDVYALAVALLEAVTGSVPFAADSTVATLTARVDRLLPVSADLGSLAAVLERAGRPDPEDRSTAAEFGRGLVQAAERLPRPDPIPIVAAGLFDPVGKIATAADHGPADDSAADSGAGDAGGAPADAMPASTAPDAGPAARPATGEADATEVPRPTVAAEHDAVGDGAPLIALTEELPAPVSAPAATETLPSPTAAAATVDAATAVTSAAPPVGLGATTALPTAATSGSPVATATEPLPTTQPVPSGLPPVTGGRRRRGELYDDERPRRRTGAVVALSAFVLLGLAAVAFAAFWLLRTKTYEVPDLVGVDEAVALNEVSGNDWVIIVETERSDEQPVVGAVIRTFPAAGSVLAEGSEFRLFVSEGPEFRVLPTLTGLTVEEAQAQLETLQLSSFVDSEEFDEEAAPGVVLSWVVRGDASKVAGDEVLPGTNIALTASKGPAPRVVPSVVGSTLDEAVAAAEAVQLGVVAGPDEFSDDVPEGIIISQSVDAGSELPRDETFTVVVSKGRDLVALPDLEGLSFDDAQQVLTDAGFTIGSLLGTTDGVFQSISIATEPIGDLYPRGTPVDLIFL